LPRPSPFPRIPSSLTAAETASPEGVSRHRKHQKNPLSSARTVGSLSGRFREENISGSAAVPAVRNGGTAIWTRCIGKRYMSSPAHVAADRSLPTAMRTGNIAPTPAISQTGLEVIRMSKKDFERETDYMLSIQIAKNLLEKGLLTEEEYAVIDTKLIEKYQPKFGTLFSETT
jgi:hypothetical protein